MKEIFSTKKSLLFTVLMFTALLFTSCMKEDDDAIDLSKLQADFAMLTTNSEAMTVGFLTDDNVYRTLAEPMNISGAKADTTYREFVYYYETSNSYVKLYGFSSVYVCEPKAEDNYEEIKTDPVGLQSIWLSNNNSYINLTLYVMTGYSSSSGDTDQIIDIIRSTDEERGGITKLTLYHDQNNIAEYYSSTVYLSIPVKGNFESGEAVNIEVNTYSDGEVSNILTIPQL